MQCVFDDGLAHHAGGSCRVLERVDGDVVCAARAGGEVVLSTSNAVSHTFRPPAQQACKPNEWNE